MDNGNNLAIQKSGHLHMDTISAVVEDVHISGNALL